MNVEENKVKLYNLNHSQGFRILWLLHHLDIPHELVSIERNKEREYPLLKTLHPLGKSPILKINDKIYAESRLVAEQVNNLNPGVLLKKSDEEREKDAYFTEFATATMTLDSMLCLIFDVMYHSTPTILRPLVGLITSPLLNAMAQELYEPLKVMHNHLVRHEYFGGDTIGLSDFMMSWPIELIYKRKYLNLADERWSNVGIWRERIVQLDSYKSALEASGGYDLTLL